MELNTEIADLGFGTCDRNTRNSSGETYRPIKVAPPAKEGPRTEQLKLFNDNNPYSLRLDFFSGPMDLLLHLVSQHELPIEEVPLAQVADQYLEIVERNARFLDLDRATEYLVIAAELLAYKSASLLPQEVAEISSEELDVFDTRFFDNLRERLKAYELTKNRAIALVEHPQLGVDVFSRLDRKALLPTPEMLAEPEDSHSLGQMFAGLLKRIGAAGNSLRIKLEPISVVSFMMKAVDFFGGKGEQTQDQKRVSGSFISFVSTVWGTSKFAARESAAPDGSETHWGGVEDGSLSSRSAVIGGFVAVLELVKRGLISVSQNPGEDIQVSMRMEAVSEGISSAEFESEFDQAGESASIEQGDGESAQEDSYTQPPLVAERKVVSMQEFRDSLRTSSVKSLEAQGDASARFTGGPQLKTDIEEDDGEEELREVQNV